MKHFLILLSAVLLMAVPAAGQQNVKELHKLYDNYLKIEKEKAKSAPKSVAEKQTRRGKKKSLAIAAASDVLSDARSMAMVSPRDVMTFCDDVCKEFGNDPDLMESIATAMFTLYGNEQYGVERFNQLKKMHPKYEDVYYSQGLLYHGMAWMLAPTKNGVYFDKAKEQIEGAKRVAPNSPEPYMRWVRWQAKYDPESIKPEIITAKEKFPDYPILLYTARIFDNASEADKPLLLNAREYYRMAERKHTTMEDYVNYSLVCYRIGDVEKKAEDFEEGVKAANEGLSRYPNEASLLRMKLWNEAYLATLPRQTALEKKERTEQALASAQTFASLSAKGKNFEHLPIDYYWMGTMDMELKQYADAIGNYQKQMAMNGKDSIKNALALRNIVDCYTETGRYSEAEAAFDRYRQYKKSKKMRLTIFDYSKLYNVYNYLGADTLASRDERICLYHKADSVLQLMGELSPGNIGYVNNSRLSLTMQIIQAEEGEVNVSRPEILEASTRLTKSILSIPEVSRTDTDKYYLLRGYRFAMEHYIFIDENVKAWEYSDSTLQVANALEHNTLNASRQQDYEEMKERASLVYDAYKTFVIKEEEAQE